jgi:excisionase family DNA binding protein
MHSERHSTATNKTQPAYFSGPAAAKYAGFSAPTIAAAIKRGQLKAYRVQPSGPGTRASVRIAREDLDAWIRGEVGV